MTQTTANTNEKGTDGMCPYLVVAYRLKGETYWNLEACPPPFEDARCYLENKGVEPVELQLVFEAFQATPPSFGSLFYIGGATEKALLAGWKLDHPLVGERKWYAPSENVPMPDGMEEASSVPISVRLLNIHVGYMELEFRQGDEVLDRNHFDCLLSDPLPDWALLIRTLKKYGYGQFAVWEHFFFSLSVWSDPDGMAYVRVTREDRHLDCKIPVETLVAQFKELFDQILTHPDFVVDYAFFAMLDGLGPEFEEKLRLAWEERQRESLMTSTDLPTITIEFSDKDYNYDLDEQETFEQLWWRENILSVPLAKEIYDWYCDILKNLD